MSVNSFHPFSHVRRIHRRRLQGDPVHEVAGTSLQLHFRQFLLCSDSERHGNSPVLARRSHKRERAHMPTLKPCSAPCSAPDDAHLRCAITSQKKNSLGSGRRRGAVDFDRWNVLRWLATNLSIAKQCPWADILTYVAHYEEPRARAHWQVHNHVLESCRACFVHLPNCFGAPFFSEHRKDIYKKTCLQKVFLSGITFTRFAFHGPRSLALNRSFNRSRYQSTSWRVPIPLSCLHTPSTSMLAHKRILQEVVTNCKLERPTGVSHPAPTSLGVTPRRSGSETRRSADVPLLNEEQHKLQKWCTQGSPLQFFKSNSAGSSGLHHPTS